MGRTIPAVLLSMSLLANGPSAFAQAVSVVQEFVGGAKLGAVWPDSGFFNAARGCLDLEPHGKFDGDESIQKDCLAGYMQSQGASAQAIAFMRLAPVPAAIKQIEYHQDAAVVYAAMMWPDGSDGWALIGRSGEVVPLWQSRLDKQRAFKKRLPDDSLWPAFGPKGWPQVVKVGDGGERYVFQFSASKCRACAIDASVEAGFDFDESGSFAGARILKLIPAETPARAESEQESSSGE